MCFSFRDSSSLHRIFLLNFTHCVYFSCWAFCNSEHFRLLLPSKYFTLLCTSLPEKYSVSSIFFLLFFLNVFFLQAFYIFFKYISPTTSSSSPDYFSLRSTLSLMIIFPSQMLYPNFARSLFLIKSITILCNTNGTTPGPPLSLSVLNVAKCKMDCKMSYEFHVRPFTPYYNSLHYSSIFQLSQNFTTIKPNRWFGQIWFETPNEIWLRLFNIRT